jgi:hypothetical protein
VSVSRGDQQLGGNDTRPDGMLSMKLPPDQVAAKYKPDSFYKSLAGFVMLAKENDVSYTPRIAADNDVRQGTVGSWVSKARKKGFLA